VHPQRVLHLLHLLRTAVQIGGLHQFAPFALQPPSFLESFLEKPVRFDESSSVSYGAVRGTVSAKSSDS